jgi:excinuclease ABC subunit C
MTASADDASMTAPTTSPTTTEAFDHRAFLKSLTTRPGVYRMLDAAGTVIYVGKARDLRKRVATYFGAKAHLPKTQALMANTQRVEVTITATEQEALLLEYNLIKEHRPRFNVMLRDDKSYPWIHVSADQEFPRFEFHRGARRGQGRYFGPYPNAGAVRETLGQIQKLFRVRQCSDTYFANRTRPCLQHQIQRCSAPCVGLVGEAEYGADVRDAMLFLEGRSDAVLQSLQARMEAAAATLDYERAALLRDQITVVRRVRASQAMTARGAVDADAIGLKADGAGYCVAVLMVRGGRVLGSRTFFPRAAQGTEPAEVLAAFVAQHYLELPAPAEVLLPEAVEDTDLLAAVLTERAGRPVALRHRVRAIRQRWLESAADNATQGLLTRRAAGASTNAKLAAVATLLGLPEAPRRIECFDISHTGGGETVASCVVFGEEGAQKSDYRRFNIRTAEPGDDYAAIAEAVQRRYTRVVKGEAPVPDLILIDGGAGQRNRAAAVLAELGLGEVPLVGVAKGPERRPGAERLVLADGSELAPGGDSPALQLIQQVRDEAHRFAVAGHRQRRSRVRQGSVLEGIEGLGPARRRSLLRAFGGLAGLKQAGEADLARVPGIGPQLAERIYARLHGGLDGPAG